MFFDSGYDLGRVLTVGLLAYLALVVTLRISGKRTLAKMNAFDMVVTVALGSTLASITLSADVALLEGLVAFAMLALAQYVAASASVRWRPARRLVKSEPALVLRDGRMLTDVLRSERLTEGEVRQAVRASGSGAVEDVAAVVLETDGTLSVVTRSAYGSGTALEDVGGASRTPASG